MNFKDWLIQEEDGKTVTLSHPKGHTMKIYTYALPKIQREQIKRLKMAKGGKVKPKVESNDHLDSGSGGVSAQGLDIRSGEKIYKGGKDTAMKLAKEEAQGRAEMERTVKPKLKGLADGGDPVDAPDIDPIPKIPNQPAPNYAQPGLANQANSTLQGIQQGANSIQSQEAIDQAKAKMAEAPQEDVVQGLQSKQQADAQALQSVKGATDDFNAYVQNNPIDPKHYQESMGSGQKAATAIGLFLGGMSTSFGGHNYAFDYLNKQIDRDIDAQKQRTENQKTVYGAYQKLFEDSNVSTALAKASMYDIYGEKIKQNAIRLGTPEAIAKAQAAQADFAQKSAQLRMEAASMASGKAQSGKPVMPGAQKKTEDPDHILNSNANDAANTLQYNPLYKDKMPAIMEQKTKADLADKAIDTIKATFPKLYQNTGGAGGYTRRFGHDLHGVPYVGGMADKAVQFLTDTNKNEAYDSDYQNVVGAVRGALQGNVSEDLLNQVVEANRPETNDPESLKAKKQQNMIDFVKSHTKTDLLEPTGLAKRR